MIVFGGGWNLEKEDYFISLRVELILETIKQFGTVSPQCAREMAYGCQIKFKSDITIAVTGNASFINPIEKKKSGLAYICIMIFDNVYDFEFVSSFTNKVDVINECVAFIYSKLWLLINDFKK